MKIKELLQQITDTCQKEMSSKNWNKNEAMRYAYITLGKELSKSAKFFFSIEGKYGEHGLSVEEMKKIHYADAGYEVTCYVSAKMLKEIFENLGIESHIMQSTVGRPYQADDGVLNIFHSYLLCTGEDDKKYFLSLNSDLVNIKLGAAPEHFGVDVPYIYNGTQSYQGPKVDNAVFTPEELLEMDKKIGYAIPIFNPTKGEEQYIYSSINDPKHDIYGRQKLPYDYLIMSLPYLDKDFTFDYEQLLSSFCHENGAPKTNFSELTTTELREVQWYVFHRCLNLVKKNFNLTNIDLNRFLDIFDSPELDTKKLSSEASKFVQELGIDKNDPRMKAIQTQPFRTLSQAIKFITIIDKIADPATAKTSDANERSNLRYLYNENKNKTSMLFLSQETLDLYMGDKNPTNEFLVEKILSSMEEDFECSTSRVCSYRPVFSTKMQAVEQAKFLKDYLRTLLKLELPSEADFNSRIMFSSLAEIGDPDKNAFMIYVKSKDNNPAINSYSMVYDPETNTIDPASIPKIRNKYKILSKTVNAQINNASKPAQPSQPNDN